MKRMKRQDSTKKEKPAKKTVWDDDYFCVFSFKRKPVSDAFLDKIAEDLVHWVNTDAKAFKVSQFRLDKGITPRDWDRWINRHEGLKHANEYAKEKIGNHREKEASLKGGMYEAGMIKPTMGHYCPVWRAEQVYLAELNKKLADQQGNVTVIMNEMPTSDDVPMKGTK